MAKKILSTIPIQRKRKPKESFVGGWIPQNLSNYITLYCYAKKVPKTSIVREQLKKWVREKQKTLNLEELELELVKTILNSFHNMEGISFETFKVQLKYELKKRQLEPDMVGKLLKMVDDEKTKES